jgi:hypothetical protein
MSQEISRKGGTNSKLEKALNFRRLLKSIGSENHDPVNINKVDQYVEDEDVGN